MTSDESPTVMDEASLKKQLELEIQQELKSFACCGRIRLAKGVDVGNFWALMFVASTAIGFLVYLNAMQGFLLTAIYDVDIDDVGTQTGYLGIADEIWSIVTLGLWGTVSDIWGRRTVVTLGYLHIVAGCILIPNGGNVFPGLMFSRLVYAQGASALASMLSALLGDYISTEDRGKASGLLGLFSGFGALFAVFVLVTELPPNICVANTYYVTAALAFGCAIYAFFNLQKHERLADQDVKEVEEKNPIKLLKEGFKYGRENRHLALAYMAGFLARGDSVITSVFLSLWVNKYYTDNDLCFDENSTEFSTCDENLANEDELSCPDAYTSYRILSGVAQVFGLIIAPFFGVYGDRYKPESVLLFVASLGIVSYGLAFAVDDPDSAFAIIVASLWSISGTGMVIAAQVQLVKNMPVDLKGTVAGTFSIIGALGVMFFTYVGGVLFDNWFNTAPFALAMFVSIGIAVGCVYVKSLDANSPPESQTVKAQVEVPEPADGSI